MQTLVREILAKLDGQSSSLDRRAALTRAQNDQLVFIRRAVITPSRVLFYFPEANSSNRVTRQYDADNFLRVRFRDEDLRKLNMSQIFADMKDVYAMIYAQLCAGLQLCDRHFEFLAMSSSQLREHACWLFAKQRAVSAAHVRAWMGDFSDIKCIGKYAARLGQSLSSSIETFKSEDFTVIPDMNVRDPLTGVEYCFTDGIGQISKERAIHISEKHYSKKYISAFQIRFAGFKGVVAVNPDLYGQQLVFRNSMKKFDSGYARLDVLNIADYIPCYLNRQVIIILSSLGVPDSAFINLQDKMLRELSNMLMYKETAASYILKYFRTSGISRAQNSVLMDYSRDEFFRDLLKTIRQKQLQDLIRKSRIFVSKGRILMGCIDETATLKPDEVFIQCSSQLEQEAQEEADGMRVRTSALLGKHFIVDKRQVVVAKNPCMHPGDVRVLRAVDVPELRHMIDVIVFPSRGPRPITNMCSGSDLDGDLYFVTWEPTLIPTTMHEPMDYSQKGHIKLKDCEIVIEDIIRFFVEFIEVDQLGRLANAHVAISDNSPLGVKDPICIELAKQFSLAVDFPKTGVIAEMPPGIKKLSYPDFMGKSRAESYQSSKVIGIMYRKCMRLFTGDSFRVRSGLAKAVELNRSLLVADFEALLSEANELYVSYRDEIERLLAYFGCSQEAEIFSSVRLTTETLSDYDKDLFTLCSQTMSSLWSHTRAQFDAMVAKHARNGVKNARAKCASAWYYACYTHKTNRQWPRVLSFPWVVEDVLLADSSSSSSSSSSNSPSRFRNVDTFAASVARQFAESLSEMQSVSRYLDKVRLCDEVSHMVGSRVLIAGAFGLFLFEESCDAQFIIVRDSRGNPKLIHNQILEILINKMYR